MRNGLSLLAIVTVTMANGLDTVALSPLRQLAFAVLAVLAYLHGRRLPTRWWRWIFGAAAIAGLALMVPLDHSEGVTALLVTCVFVLLPWLVGRYRLQQARLVDAGRERVARLEREQEFAAEQAQLRERARIAADVHDSLGHQLALIALRAGALELSPRLSEPDRLAAAELREAAVSATDRLRDTIGMLRDGRGPTSPGEETVAQLVEGAQAAGMPVTLRVHGDLDQLPELTDRAVHRIVQEGLTNAARYAPGGAVAVEIDAGDRLVVSVTDTGGDAPTGPAGAGTGLAGLAERVRLFGGDFEAGPVPGGFGITAELPMQREKRGRR